MYGRHWHPAGAEVSTRTALLTGGMPAASELPASEAQALMRHLDLVRPDSILAGLVANFCRVVCDFLSPRKGSCPEPLPENIS